MRRTLKHLAEEMNVSAMTVSWALRGAKGVRETTRLQIQEYARKANYRPGNAAGAQP